MQANKNNTVISIFILIILIGWIYLVWLVVAPFYLQKEPENYKKYGNTLSSYIEIALKDKPIADYKIPDRYATAQIDISKVVKFKWDKAVIYYSYDICKVLEIDKEECTKNSFDEIVKVQRHFIAFTYRNKVVYKEIFEDDILAFGQNTYGRKLTPNDSVVSVFRNMRIKHSKDEIKKSKYSDLVVLFIFPIVGFLFGFKFYAKSLTIGILLIVPIIIFLMILPGSVYTLGLIFSLGGTVLILMVSGVGMLIGAFFNKDK